MDTGKSIIRKPLETEVSLLSNFAAETFRETYSAFNTEEDMQDYISRHFDEDSLRSEMHDSKKQFLIAEKNGEMAGYCLLDTSRGSADIPAGRSIEISRIYVAKKFHGERIGALLMQKCIDHARENDYDYLWLGVWQKNERAISFYKKWHFEIAGSVKFILGSDEQEDFIMVRKL